MGRLHSVEDLPMVDLPEDYLTNVGPFLAGMYEEHGPIFRAGSYAPAFGGRDIIYMVGPEANRFVLAGGRLKFSHHEGWGRTLGVIDLIGNGLLTMDGEEHDRHRRMMNPAFAIRYMDRYLPLMNRIIRERTADWAERHEVDRFRELYYGLLNLGMMVETQEEYEEGLRRLQTDLYGLLLPKIHERRARPTDDVLGMLVRARGDEGNTLSDEQLIAHTNILLIAGHETSTSLSAWLLYLLSEHPDYLGRVLGEQDSLLGDDAEPTLADIRRMKVLDDALSEAERLYPPVANGPRGVVEDFEFGGYQIPAGAFVFYSIAAAHRLPSLWEEPDKFDPDRFAPPREEHKKKPYSLVGFGGGPRICIGINFAQVEVKAMVSRVLRDFRLETVPGQDLVQFYRGTGLPLHGIKTRVTKRLPA